MTSQAELTEAPIKCLACHDRVPSLCLVCLDMHIYAAEVGPFRNGIQVGTLAGSAAGVVIGIILGYTIFHQ